MHTMRLLRSWRPVRHVVGDDEDGKRTRSIYLLALTTMTLPTEIKQAIFNELIALPETSDRLS